MTGTWGALGQGLRQAGPDPRTAGRATRWARGSPARGPAARRGHRGRARRRAHRRRLLLRDAGAHARRGHPDPVGRPPAFPPVAVAVTLVVAWACGLYAQIWRHASVAEARRVLLAGLATPRSWSRRCLVARRPPVPAQRERLRCHGRHHAARRGAVPVPAVRVQPAPGRRHRPARRGPRGRRRRLPSWSAACGATRAAGLVPVVVLDDDPRKHGRSCSASRSLGSLRRPARLAREPRAAPGDPRRADRVAGGRPAGRRPRRRCRRAAARPARRYRSSSAAGCGPQDVRDLRDRRPARPHAGRDRPRRRSARLLGGPAGPGHRRRRLDRLRDRPPGRRLRPRRAAAARPRRDAPARRRSAR